MESAQDPAKSAGDATSSARQIRGSGLLLAGRFITIAVGFVTQVVIVRYLSKDDFGAFAYALAIVSLAASVAAFGLDKATSRFLPMYEERDQHGRVLGLVVLGVGTMLLIGIGIAVVVYVTQGALAGATDPTAAALLLILVVLAPVQALDPLATSILAALSHPRIIFIRRYVLEPIFEVAVLVFVVLTASTVVVLALGQVVAGLLGLALYGSAVVRVLRDRGYLEERVRSRFAVPWREVFSYSVPLLSSDLVLVLRGALVVVLLEAFGTTTDVADFRAVFPQARLNLVVLQSFTFLYLPLAARLVAKHDLMGLHRARAQSTAWVTLISFPLFAASALLAGQVVVLLYGEPYASSAPVLAVLSIGFFVSAVLGFAGLTLRALGSVRYIVGVDLVAAALSIVLYFAIIPTYGAVGAAAVTTVTLVLQGVAYHVGVHRAGGGATTEAGLARLAGQVVLATIALALVQALVAPPLWIGILVVGVVWILLVRLNRTLLDVADTFPEVLRIPVLGPVAARVLR